MTPPKKPTPEARKQAVLVLARMPPEKRERFLRIEMLRRGLKDKPKA